MIRTSLPGLAVCVVAAMGVAVALAVALAVAPAVPVPVQETTFLIRWIDKCARFGIVLSRGLAKGPGGASDRVQRV